MLKIAFYIIKIYLRKLPKYSNLKDNLFLQIIKKRANGNAII